MATTNKGLRSSLPSRLFHPDVPFAPRKFRFFYGWLVAVVSTVGIVMSIPGQTMGVSVFTDHLIRAAGLSRLSLSNTYLAGTIGSGLLLPLGGRILDRLGARRTAVASSSLLALTLCYLAGSDRIAHWLGDHFASLRPPTIALGLLVIGFTSLRLSGQGMLTMVSRTMLAKWFERRRGLVSGLSGVVVSFSFAAAPLGLSAWIGRAGWRGAWLQMALVIGIGMGLVAWLFFRDNPEECGLTMDGRPPDSGSAGSRSMEAMERDQAVRTLAFWSVTLALAAQGLIMTGFVFHIVDLGAEHGLQEPEVVVLFLPMALVSTVFGYVIGALSDRVRIRSLLYGMMTLQAVGAAAAASFGSPAWRAVALAGLGAAGGFFGPLSTVALPRFFGRLHLGAIAGIQMMCMVIASAFGPSLMALSKAVLGTYDVALLGFAGFGPIVMALASKSRSPREEALFAG